MSQSKIADIARACGTSLASVSRAFRADAPISEDLRTRILQEAERIGYVPPRKRGRAAARSISFALVVSDLENPFYPLVLKKFSDVAQRAGWDMTVFVAPPRASVDHLIAQVLRADVDAVVLTTADLASTFAVQCRQRGLPVILFNRVQVDADMQAICADNYEGGLRAAERLIETERTRMAFIGGRRGTSTHLERRRGFLDGLSRREIPLLDDLIGEYSYDLAGHVAQGLFARRTPPDAVFCANDQMAFATIDAAHDAGLKPGRDLSIIGYDDVPMAAWRRYQLTTIAQPVEAMIAKTFQCLTQVAHDQQMTQGITLVPPQLVLRGTA